MKKVLNLVDPPIQTYQGESFILAIMLANDNVKNIYYNSYINLMTYDDNDIRKLVLCFSESLWENYRLKGLANMQLYGIKHLAQEFYIEFLKERLDQNNYILLFDIDEYYLSYSIYYKKYHYIHDTYIYGYEGNTFYVMAYNRKHLKRIKVDMKEIYEAILYRFNEDNNISFCIFSINTIADVKFDLKEILVQMRNYIDGIGNDQYIQGKSYGIKIYNDINEYLRYYISSQDVNDIQFDKRIFRELWEHKKIMSNRILELKRCIDFDDSKILLCNEIEKVSNMLFLLAIKYSSTHNKEILKRMQCSLNYIRDREVVLFSEIITLLEGTYCWSV